MINVIVMNNKDAIKTFRVTSPTEAYDYTIDEDVTLRVGEELVAIDASDKGTIFRTANGHEVSVAFGDDKGIK